MRPRSQQRGNSNRGVQHPADPQRAVEAIKLDEKKRENCTRNRPQHICQIQKTERAARLVIGRCGWRTSPPESWLPCRRTMASESAPAMRPRPDNTEEKRARRCLPLPQERGVPTPVPPEPQTPKLRSTARSVHTAQRTESELFAMPANPCPGSRRADPQSRHEHRQNDGHTRCGDAELRHRQPQPDQLIQNAAKP